MSEFDSYTLGESDQLLEIAGKDDLKQLIVSMSQQAIRQILIFSHDLDAFLFDNDELYQAVKTLAIKNRYTHIDIVLQDIKPITKNGHRLLTLARRTPSKVSIKLAAKDDQRIMETFLIFDNNGYLLHKHPERYEAQASFYESIKAKHLQEQFGELWDRATIDSSLRKLSL